ncbi:DUF1249 domain-containing protein [Bacterioplanoides sp. SCSIO 12839]|uniref:DUF1249 domain-containing protein n=1 Tax=Bacterioplanoides sp. SCSIO 12839 TaxID=2829569 RepID=UPI002101E524|nr:DUF1249 domain-containing protein [Bacterioplanoides sp. SCSIO 12839]UTW48421.1 DUF1249 domain-containing protein [Bacterioplanoides sp. SCSIO 12839]
MLRKKRYVPDLQELSSLAEKNYLRFFKLFPQMEAGSERTFIIRGSGEHEARIIIRVEEVHPYTTMLEIIQQGLSPEWIQPPRMQVRLYHDANMAEVLSYQNQKRFEGRYQYPNPTMRLPDEKLQLNRFLADWLDHCLHYGHVDTPFAFTPDLS